MLGLTKLGSNLLASYSYSKSCAINSNIRNKPFEISSEILSGIDTWPTLNFLKNRFLRGVSQSKVFFTVVAFQLG